MHARTAAALSATIATLAVLLAGCDRSGSACSPIGITEHDSAGQLWTCAKNLNTGKGYWYKGTPGVLDTK